MIQQSSAFASFRDSRAYAFWGKSSSVALATRHQQRTENRHSIGFHRWKRKNSYDRNTEYVTDFQYQPITVRAKKWAPSVTPLTYGTHTEMTVLKTIEARRNIQGNVASRKKEHRERERVPFNAPHQKLP